MHQASLLALTFTLAAALVGCATSTERQPTAAPTAEDRAMLDRLERAKAEAKGLPQARDLFNHMQTDSSRKRLAQVRGDEPATEDDLARARRSVRGMVASMEAAPTWEPEPVYPVAARQGEIVIDGQADERAWQDATVAELRYDARINHTVQPPYAEARLLWDEQYLYAAFDVPDETYTAPAMDHDDNVFMHDCVELFLLPERRFGVYWELNISPSGAVLDQLCSKYWDVFFSYFRRDAQVEGLRHAARVWQDASGDGQPRGYTVEVAIPFDQLPGMTGGPRPGQAMWLLMARADRLGPGGELRFYSHGQVLGTFHNIWTMPRVTFQPTAE